MFSYYLVLRYLVATGDPSDNAVKTEIVDLSDPSKSCLLDDIPYRIIDSVGGLLGTTPVICGGRNMSGYLDDCVLYGTSQTITMNSQRAFHSAVQLNTSTIWILGGMKGLRLDSTEFITPNGAVNGPTLPEPISHACAVKFPGTGDVYLIGGGNGGLQNKVWVADTLNEFSFTQGPSMNHHRYSHVCGTMSIGAKNVIVAAGGGGVASTEILDPTSNEWVLGK